MERIHINQIEKHIGEEIVVAGFVHVRRDHGKLIFIDLRDETGIVQMVALPNHADAHMEAGETRSEWVISVRGLVKKRPAKTVKAEEGGLVNASRVLIDSTRHDFAKSDDVEIEILAITVLSEAKTPPFDITSNTSGIDEGVRLAHRYLDLRSARLQRTIRLRSDFVRQCRDFLFERKFTEIETPLLTAATSEGSRDFMVPSRLHPGKFYALPQSPQQYKQLLMGGGFERYFQVARAIRDEDLRADRGFEHTQVDIEMAFVEREDVLRLTEEMMTSVVEKMGYTIKDKPFPRFTLMEATKQFGADKFDLRTDEEKTSGVLSFAWVTDFPLFEKNGSGWTFSHNPFSAPIPKHNESFLNGEHIGEIISSQYDLVCNGYEVGGGSMRAHTPEMLSATYRIMGYDEEETKKSIGHMLEAFSYGFPPHGGIALGVERILMNLAGEDALREVQAFPMTRGGQTAVMDGPFELNAERLTELHLKPQKST